MVFDTIKLIFTRIKVHLGYGSNLDDYFERQQNYRMSDEEAKSQGLLTEDELDELMQITEGNTIENNPNGGWLSNKISNMSKDELRSWINEIDDNKK